MRRYIFDFYHRVLAPLATQMPAPVRGEIAGLLFRATHHPDFGFAHARALMARGKIDRAARLYGTPIDDPLFAATLQPGGWAKGWAKGQANEPGADPKASWETGQRTGQKTGRRTGRSGFLAQISYHGLRISADVALPLDSPDPASLSLSVNGVLLRRETCAPRATRARFRMIVPRDVLAHFPPMGQLQLHLNNRPLHAPGSGGGIGGGPGWQLHLPHGTGDIGAVIAARGLLEKKGGLRPDKDDIRARQDAYLALYTELREVFAATFDRPLLILYGTLLGQVRAEDFIPGDDDFDVGYPSPHSDPDAVRREAIHFMRVLADLGYVIELNETGRPFRIRGKHSPAWCHLDNRPVFCPDTETKTDQNPAQVWLHKHAALPLPLSDFECPDTSAMRGTEVLRPADPEAFLRAYYGPDWQVPDPGYSNSGRTLPRAAARGLNRLCLSASEQHALSRYRPQNPAGRIIPARLRPLYPLATEGPTP